MPTHKLKTGLSARVSHTAVKEYLATNWKNDVPVLATPILLWLAELACMEALEGVLGQEEMSVGYSHDVKHLAATPENWDFVIQAKLVAIDSSFLTFQVSAKDSLDEIFSGTHVRAIINRERFLSKLDNKSNAIAGQISAV